mmetsp:Transcript_71691/g.116227  ORF Transcript_71691/g.116227 Transcript_71691/m.116227 type:complete len:702 (-) Transcript_71691:476-2581(-)
MSDSKRKHDVDGGSEAKRLRTQAPADDEPGGQQTDVRASDGGGGGGGSGSGPPGDGPPGSQFTSVTLWSCDTPAVGVPFNLHHAWLLLRNRLMEREDVSGETDMKEWLMSEESRPLRSLPPESFCTGEILELMRGYVESYVDCYGVYLWVDMDGNWDLSGDDLVAGAQCCKLLEAANYLDVEIWPTHEAKLLGSRNRNGFLTHDRTFYNEVCKKLATFIVNAESIQKIRDFCGVTDAGFDDEEIDQNLKMLNRIPGVTIIPNAVAGGAGSVGDVNFSLRTYHLPAICVSIGKSATAQKIHCMYRLVCVSKDFKDHLRGEFDQSVRDVVVNGPIQHPISTRGSNAPLREVLQILSNMAWMGKAENVYVLWKIAHKSWTRTSALNTDEMCMVRFALWTNSRPFLECSARRDRDMSRATYQELVRGAGRDAFEFLLRIDDIAHQRREEQINDAVFLKSLRENIQNLRNLCRQYIYFSKECKNITDLMLDSHLLNNPAVLRQDIASQARLCYLSEQMGVAVHKGAGGGAKEQAYIVQHHQLFTANCWYLRVRVTQHEKWEEEAQTEVLPQYERDDHERIVYVVDKDFPIIKMTIRNIKRNNQSGCKKTQAVAMVDDVMCDVESDVESDLEGDRQLLITHTVSAEEEDREFEETTLNEECPETDCNTKVTTEVALKFYTTAEEEMTCNIDDKETKNAVFRIVLRVA